MTPEKELFNLQQEQALQTQNIGLAHQLSERTKQEKQNYFDRLMETGVKESSARQLMILLGGDLPLASFSSGKINEMDWIVKIYERLFIAQHPGSESIYQDEYRQFLYDSEEASLCSLSGMSMLEIAQVCSVISARLSRSLEGFQQNTIGQTMIVSETRRTEPDAKPERKRLF
jgi:hypothetical protein